MNDYQIDTGYKFARTLRMAGRFLPPELFGVSSAGSGWAARMAAARLWLHPAVVRHYHPADHEELSADDRRRLAAAAVARYRESAERAASPGEAEVGEAQFELFEMVQLFFQVTVDLRAEEVLKVLLLVDLPEYVVAWDYQTDVNWTFDPILRVRAILLDESSVLGSPEFGPNAKAAFEPLQEAVSASELGLWPHASIRTVSEIIEFYEWEEDE